MEDEFQNIGKKMPYQVPEGFFDHITGDTLAEAGRRRKSRKYAILLWGSLAVAASLAAILLLVTQVAPVTRENLPLLVVQSAPGESSAPENESIESILASVDDEELIGWVQSLENDPFTEITENNLP